MPALQRVAASWVSRMRLRPRVGAAQPRKWCPPQSWQGVKLDKLAVHQGAFRPIHQLRKRHLMRLMRQSATNAQIIRSVGLPILNCRFRKASGCACCQGLEASCQTNTIAAVFIQHSEIAHSGGFLLWGVHPICRCSLRGRGNEYPISNKEFPMMK